MISIISEQSYLNNFAKKSQIKVEGLTDGAVVDKFDILPSFKQNSIAILTQ